MKTIINSTLFALGVVAVVIIGGILGYGLCVILDLIITIPCG